MTYEEIVFQVREGFENADARKIFEHIAVQVNIEGEGSGAFYIEVANRNAIVEPYDYYDRDGLLTADAETLIAIAQGHLSMQDAIDSGKMLAVGNREKLNIFFGLKIKKKEKKATAKQTAAKQMSAKQETPKQAAPKTKEVKEPKAKETKESKVKETKAKEEKAKEVQPKETKSSETK